MSVAAEPTFAAAARPRRNGIGLSLRLRHASTSTGGHGQTHNVVAEHRGQSARGGDERGKEQARRNFEPGEFQRDARVESAKAKLGGQDHEAKKQGERGRVDGGDRLVEPERARCEERDRAERRHTSPVELEPGKTAEYHPGVHDQKHNENEGIHGDGGAVKNPRVPC